MLGYRLIREFRRGLPCGPLPPHPVVISEPCSPGLQFLLLGGDPAVVRPGARLLVTGRLLSGVGTICMQGYPFQVVDAVPV